MKVYWFWFNTTYACGAVVCNEKGYIIHTCPIYYKKMKGKHFRTIESEFKSKGLLKGYKLIYVTNT